MLIGDSLKAEFGRKIYKLCFDIGCTCPTRDGTKGTGGCIFCTQAGSGEFSVRYTGKQEEIDRAKARLSQKLELSRAGFIAYFQNYTNTYNTVAYLEPLFTSVLRDPSVVGLSIATRPDCLGPEILEMLARLCRQTTVFVELGLQTIHPVTAEFIRRGYPLCVYDDAVKALRSIGARIVTHLIFGLPYPVHQLRPAGAAASGKNVEIDVDVDVDLDVDNDANVDPALALESEAMMLASAEYVGRSGVNGVKFQLLQVLRGTDLAALYQRGAFRTLTADEYISTVVKAVRRLPPETVIHRLTGDPPRKLLIAPDWCTDKKRILNRLRAELQL